MNSQIWVLEVIGDEYIFILVVLTLPDWLLVLSVLLFCRCSIMFSSSTSLVSLGMALVLVVATASFVPTRFPIPSGWTWGGVELTHSSQVALTAKCAALGAVRWAIMECSVDVAISATLPTSMGVATPIPMPFSWLWVQWQTSMCLTTCTKNLVINNVTQQSRICTSL